MSSSYDMGILGSSTHADPPCPSFFLASPTTSVSLSALHFDLECTFPTLLRNFHSPFPLTSFFHPCSHPPLPAPKASHLPGTPTAISTCHILCYGFCTVFRGHSPEVKSGCQYGSTELAQTGKERVTTAWPPFLAPFRMGSPSVGFSPLIPEGIPCI